MTMPVFLTIDTGIVWRHHAGRLDPAAIVARSLDPAGVGLGYQLGLLRQHGLKASFFVDPMPALVFGLDPVRQAVDAILDAGQDVQLLLHPQWAGAVAGDGGAAHGRFALADYGLGEQRALIGGARDLLVAAGAPLPAAFRGGGFSANDETLVALAALGFAYDCSHNGAEHPWPSAIDLPLRQIAPVGRAGLVAVPVTLIEEHAGALRGFDICALSAGEMSAALDHAVESGHAAVTIVHHASALANHAGISPDGVHLRRFQALCSLLDERRDELRTVHFADRPPLALGRPDTLLEPNALRLGWRRAEQLWSSMIAERAA